MDPDMDDTGRDDDADERPEAEALEELVGAALAALESAGREAVDELLRGHPDQADVVRLRLARQPPREPCEWLPAFEALKALTIRHHVGLQLGLHARRAWQDGGKECCLMLL